MQLKSRLVGAQGLRPDYQISRGGKACAQEFNDQLVSEKIKNCYKKIILKNLTLSSLWPFRLPSWQDLLKNITKTPLQIET
jgi:hypothetical protein